jgi:hypothetical protein
MRFAEVPLLLLLVTPDDVPLGQGASVVFKATGFPYDPSVTWSVEEGGGTITAQGDAEARYAAPAADGIYHVLAHSGSNGLQPPMIGLAVVRVGAPGLPRITAEPAPPLNGFPAVNVVITASGPAATDFVVRADPLEPGVVCNTYWLIPWPGAWILGDYTQTMEHCGLLYPGHTYTFTIQGFNQYGGGPVGRSNPVTIPTTLAANRKTTGAPVGRPRFRAPAALPTSLD